MELFSAAFLSAFFAIIVIDLVLAGDNAIVIALAARNLPPHLRTRAIAWGCFGAVAVRTAMTLVVVWLLKVPGLLLAGGLLLVWIAYKLLVDNRNGNGQHRIDSATGFWTAMKTIVVADALMGLDNVLAVAGAAQGSFVLVVLGLLVSVPIVIGGSQLILKFVERYPIIVYIGAGVLAWTAAGMILHEPMLQDLLAQSSALAWLAYIGIIGVVLWSGFTANHGKVKARVEAHVVDDSVTPEAARAEAGIIEGDGAMRKILVPIDGSPNSLKALQHVVNQVRGGEISEVHLLHVRTPLSQHTARFLNKRTRAAYHREEAEKALEPARALLARFGFPHTAHVELGDKAHTIHRLAQRLHADRIVMGTARKNSFTRMIEDSVTNKVLELTQVPVEIIAGESISKIERYLLPAGAGGAALALVLLAVD
jgi:YjbE family integral membrane protein